MRCAREDWIQKIVFHAQICHKTLKTNVIRAARADKDTVKSFLSKKGYNEVTNFSCCPEYNESIAKQRVVFQMQHFLWQIVLRAEQKKRNETELFSIVDSWNTLVVWAALSN